jgi:hypothetical protein
MPDHGFSKEIFTVLLEIPILLLILISDYNANAVHTAGLR